MSYPPLHRRLPLVIALASALSLIACGGGSATTSTAESIAIPAAPTGLGYAESADYNSSLTAYVDDGATNVRGDACHSTLETNAGVRALSGMLDLWTPRSLFVDAGQTATASGTCAAVVASDWDGIPGSATDGTIKNATIHKANIAYVESATGSRTSAQELAAYLDDRRGKGYSVTDGLGPLTTAWRSGTQQATSITSIAADATTTLYSDTGNNIGVATSAGNTSMGYPVDLISAMGTDASTEPAKRYFKYARPYRWSSSVIVAPSLVLAKSITPATDGGFLSGHTAEGWRDALAMAYAVPERFQEMLTRAMEMGENRILAGMHSPLDVMGGRIQATAVTAYNLNKSSNVTLKANAYKQAHTWLQTQAGLSSADALNTYAHSGTTSTDRFADWASNKAYYVKRMTYGFPTIAATTAAVVVPKGAEVLLETRQPYLTAAQRRVVLKTTALSSGYPLLDSSEGWGRLNLFAAADGYGAFNGDVSITMDASLGGFNAADTWKNDIAGSGMLTKSGSGALTLSGNNSWAGGTQLTAGSLIAASVNALGKGDVYQSGGTLGISSALALAGKYTQLAGGTLELQLGSAGQGRLTVSGQATLQGTLTVKLQSGYTPSVGDTINLISAGSRQGTFSAVTLSGYKVTPIYTSTGVQLRIDATA